MEWTISTSITTPGFSRTFKLSESASTELKIVDEAIPANQTNLLLEGAIRAAGIKKLLIVSSVNMNVKTNATVSPGNNFDLVAGKEIIWDASAPSTYPCPITVDVTKFYVTTTTAGTLTILALYDPTA